MSTLPADPIAAIIDELVERLARRLLQLQHVPEPEQERSPWMAIAAAAAYLDLPRQRLYKLTASGAIPHYKQEGRLLFHRRELDAWLQRFADGERDWLPHPDES